MSYYYLPLGALRQCFSAMKMKARGETIPKGLNQPFNGYQRAGWVCYFEIPMPTHVHYDHSLHGTANTQGIQLVRISGPILFAGGFYSVMVLHLGRSRESICAGQAEATTLELYPDSLPGRCPSEKPGWELSRAG